MVRFYWVEKTSQSSIMSEKIDVGKVEKELVAALAADRKYERENDAKLRAVTQRVATYEEFRFKSGRGSVVQRCCSNLPVHSPQGNCERVSLEGTGSERYEGRCLQAALEHCSSWRGEEEGGEFLQYTDR